MNIRMFLLAALPALLAGCMRPPEQGDFPPLYHPHDKLSLVRRGEHVMNTSEGKSTVAAELDLLLETRPGDREGDVEVDVRVARVAGSETYRGADGTTRLVSFDSEKAPAVDDKYAAESRRTAEAMKSVRMTATISAEGRIVRFSYNGRPMDWSKPPEDDQESKAHSGWLTAAVCRGILGDSLAYLPSNPVASGQRWQLVRRHIFPVHAFPIAMLMGSPLLTERSTCRVDDLRFRPEGRIAVVAFSGRREAVLPPEEEKSAATLRTGGEARLNIDTGTLELRVVSEVKFPRHRDPGGDSRFVDELTLKPIVEPDEKN